MNATRYVRTDEIKKAVSRPRARGSDGSRHPLQYGATRTSTVLTRPMAGKTTGDGTRRSQKPSVPARAGTRFSTW